jgi:hypothetical protein
MKWDALVNKITGDIVAFMDNLRASGHCQREPPYPTVEMGSCKVEPPRGYGI